MSLSVERFSFFRGPSGNLRYPFGDDVGDPLFFVTDAVREAVRSGKLRVLGRAGDVAPQVDS